LFPILKICFFVDQYQIILIRKNSTETDPNRHNLFKNLFDEYYAPLCEFANNYTKDSSISEDLVQEVFVGLWHDREKLDHIHSVKAYLYTSVRNKCLNHLKHLRIVGKHEEHRKSATENDIFFVDHIIEEETHRLIYQAVKELPTKCREIVLLGINGLKNSEIAEELNISINTVKTQKAIAYKQLRIKLKDLIILSPLFLSQLFR
jgi:RNA polymerase sigma-70 factor (family 1)